MKTQKQKIVQNLVRKRSFKNEIFLLVFRRTDDRIMFTEILKILFQHIKNNFGTFTFKIFIFSMK